MMPQTKAKDLLETFLQTGISVWEAKECVKISIDEIIAEIECMKKLKELKSTKRYLSFWQQVKSEIIRPS